MKRLTLTDYMVTLFFIFLLVCIVGAFFFGIKIGEDRSAAKYEDLLLAQKTEAHELGAYHQQYLVSFYHTVFLPYHEFQKKWFDTMSEIETQTHSQSGASLMKEVADMAESKHEQIKTAHLPETSPLLVEAQNHFLKSLKLFSSAMEETDLSGSGPGLLSSVNNSAYYNEAKKFGLKGIHSYYSAIRLWNETVEPVPNKDLLEKETLTFDEWASMNLNLKNEYIAAWLEKTGHFKDFYVQDLVFRIDETIRSKQAEKMNLNEITRIAQTLVETKAVRFGDFIKGKNKYYASESLPQVPFFFAQP